MDGSYHYSAIIKINLGVKVNLVVTPNPAKNNFTIQYSNTVPIRQISIVDITGRKIKEFNPSNNLGSIWVDAGNFTVEVYLIKMLIDDNTVITEKLIVQ